MSRYKLYPDQTNLYFCTNTIVEWQCVFKEDKYFQIVLDSLKYCQKNKGLVLFGYVIMLNHMHLMASYDDQKSLSAIMRDFKRHTSKYIAQELEHDNERLLLYIFRDAAQKRRSNIRYKVWQDEFHPIAIFSDTWFEEKMTYIHNNPVRKGFVERPEDWKYSSARNWILDDNSLIDLNFERF